MQPSSSFMQSLDHPWPPAIIALLVVALVAIVIIVVQPAPAVGTTCGAVLLGLAEAFRRVR
ncbi:MULTISPECIES: hypothetical protein [Kitasatospora]|uniref:hypothetical protein n=1 Tax=Kitasatospora TaxID=2063 RepID=UPI000C6FEF59|nr:hypothetical protein [Kitasatospora sp. GP30]MDH6139868.1 hypothetical protein [Kitasatospora sp. GP30]